METLIIQVGLKQGRSADIYKTRDRELYIGRAYSNDIVLSDPYVAPQQLRLYRYGTDDEQLGWHMNVLDASNPTLINGEPLTDATAAVSAGDTITVGRTQLQVFADDTPVEPTRKLLVSSWLHGASRNAAIPAALFVLAALLDGVSNYLVSNTDGDWKAHGTFVLTGMAVLLLWAGAWAVVGRLLRHQHHFSQQLLVTSVVALLGLLVSPVEAYVEFVSNNLVWRDIVTYAAGTLLFAYLLHYNFFFATNIKHTGMWALGISIGISSLTFLFSAAVDDNGLEIRPAYSNTLLAPGVAPSGASSLEDYLQRMDRVYAQTESD